MKGKNSVKKPTSRLTMLVVLVAFVFFVLLVSMVASGMLLFLMNHFGFMQPVSENRLHIIIIFMLVVSLIVATLVATVLGNISLRPIKKFIDATESIAEGNFNVRVDEGGPNELRQLAVSFNAMARELGSTETLRDDFVSNISHEFKTPVVSIRGFARLIKKGNLSQEQHDEYIDIIISESERLTQLSSNVLLLSKLNSTEALQETAEFSLDEQLRRTILILEQQIVKKDINLEIELAPYPIVSNEELLSQVWINIIGNAVKFTPEGGDIFIKLSGDGNAAAVSVRDSGAGMEPETISRMFDKFYQGDRSRSTEGNGLGLSLVKRILELCGGEIEVKSEIGKGSEFIVRLPMK